MTMVGRYKPGRVLFEAIEIDQDFCQNIYGDSVCGAVLTEGASKCYNTIGTCQALDGYDGGVLTLRFCMDNLGVPRDGNAWIPLLTSVRIKPAHLNPGGANRSMSAFGKRATISVSFKDAPSSDRVTDLYQAERLSGEAQFNGEGYNPRDRSTFWRKWKARNLYYLNRPMRYIRGYIEDGQVVDTETHYFVITGFKGPDRRGNVTIEGKDVLYLAQREKAKYPAPSEGKLLAGIDETETAATLDPAGVGSTYPASGVLRINGETMAYTRTGDDLALSRSRNGAVEPHGAGDTVQWVWVVESEAVDDILYDVLTNGAGIDPSYLDTAQWAAEVADHLSTLYDGEWTEPTGVQEIVQTMCEEMFFNVWFDERTNLVKIRAVRSADDETVTDLTYGSNVVKDTVSFKDRADEVITRLYINYAIKDPARDLDELSNYSVTDTFTDLDEEDDDHNRGSRSKTIFSRWITGSNGAAAERLGERLLARYKVPPRECEWQMDAKDRGLFVADFVTLRTPDVVDPDGVETPVPMQILNVQDDQPGHSLRYVGQQFQFELPPDPNDKLLVLSANRDNIVLRDWYDERYADAPAADDIVRVQIRPGIEVHGSTIAFDAGDAADWPAGITIILEIGAGAYISGTGGRGGIPSSFSFFRNGGNGAIGLRAGLPITVENNGIIGGGGGGGGASGDSGVYGGSGGGGGASYGVGGDKTCGGSSCGNDGADGGLELGGAGGVKASAIGTLRGGDGGDLGQDGTAGSSPGGTTGGTGGTAGAAVSGVSYVTYSVKGDVRGAEVG